MHPKLAGVSHTVEKFFRPLSASLSHPRDRPDNAKTLSGFGHSKLLELRESDRAGTYRTVYTVEVEGFIFVLHAFQKKSKSGIATPKQDLDLIKQRLKDVEAYCKKLIGVG